AFVHVTASAPQPLAQQDGYPIAGLLPPRDWPTGATVYDERHIPLPDGVAEPLRILVGLYDRNAPTVRAAAVDAGGSRLAEDAVVITPSR
ncbi:MAG TPA: hypothetical protein VF157_16445, partial [Chloroflexota bacterium]